MENLEAFFLLDNFILLNIDLDLAFCLVKIALFGLSLSCGINYQVFSMLSLKMLII